MAGNTWQASGRHGKNPSATTIADAIPPLRFGGQSLLRSFPLASSHGQEALGVAVVARPVFPTSATEPLLVRVLWVPATSTRGARNPVGK